VKTVVKTLKRKRVFNRNSFEVKNNGLMFIFGRIDADNKLIRNKVSFPRIDPRTSISKLWNFI